MEPKWSHEDFPPIIARVIGDLEGAQSGFVTHDQIVAYLLGDAEASTPIDAARVAGGGEHSREWFAHNMVAWFSQRITVGGSAWAARFDRQKFDGKWAYKPKTDEPTA